MSETPYDSRNARLKVFANRMRWMLQIYCAPPLPLLEISELRDVIALIDSLPDAPAPLVMLGQGTIKTTVEESDIIDARTERDQT